MPFCEKNYILGHTSVDMTAKKYAAVDPDRLKDFSQVMNFEADRPFFAPGEKSGLQLVGN